MLSYTAFDSYEMISKGTLEEVAIEIKKYIRNHRDARILVFSDSSGKQMDMDLSGTEKEVLERLKVYLSPEERAVSTGPGRPKLGVVAREVSLLPRHWEWLSTQTGGASATLRRLVEDARKNSSGKEKIKSSQERVHLMMTSLAGDFAHYEEALRALYAKDKKKFNALIGDWPKDVREYTRTLASDIWD